jgi:hypothetical protein
MMLYVVKVALKADELSQQMNLMRTWLDDNGLEPASFRLSPDGDQQVLRVSFKAEYWAITFAAHFGGLMLSIATTDAAI